jgi:hypothetical protein
MNMKPEAWDDQAAAAGAAAVQNSWLHLEQVAPYVVAPLVVAMEAPKQVEHQALAGTALTHQPAGTVAAGGDY